ncbi:MAG: FtsX-like permease family protein, partial [Nitrospinae bacterium]|nr:FtsX-like permease family protein [Nitrospinota bacterium]
MKPSQLNFRQLFGLVIAESRGAKRRMLFFVLCIAIGVGAVMTVKSFSNLVGETIQDQSKGLLSADLAIKGSWEQSQKDLEFQRSSLPAETEFLFIKELHGMSQFKNPEGKQASLITELKAIPINGPQYPFYGEFKSQPEKPLQELLANKGAVVDPSFLLKTGLKQGEQFFLGKISLRINGVVLSEPDRISRAFSIGPRVFISRASLDESGLVQPGSRVKHRTLIKLPQNFDLEKAQALLERGLTDKSTSVRTYKDMQSSLSSSIERMGQYLGALGVIALLMGGIGVAMIVRTFMAQKLDTLAILNCLGASSRTLFKIYLLQSMLMGLAGSLLGVSLGFSLTFLLPPKMEGLINLKLDPVFYWVPALQSLLLGCATTLLFCMWPLIRAVKTRPLRLFRRNFEEEEKQGARWEGWFASLTLGLGLAAMICWQAESIKRGLIFLSALVISAGVLALASFFLLKLLKALPQSGSMTRRYGMSNLRRPNNQATAI